MAGYDPTTNPRYLGDGTDLEAVRVNDEARLRDLGVRHSALMAALQALRTEGWALLVLDIEEEIRQAQVRLESCATDLEMYRLQGQIQAARKWAGVLPRLEEQEARVRGEIEELQAMLEDRI
jgi:hypothetical protein